MTDLSQFHQSAITYMQQEISGASGNEVFFVARRGQDSLISEVKAVARGKEDEVPVIYDQAFRGDFVLHNHPTGNLTPSDNDIAIASYLGNQGIGFLIIDNAVSRCYTVVDGVEAIVGAVARLQQETGRQEGDDRRLPQHRQDARLIRGVRLGHRVRHQQAGQPQQGIDR